MTDTYIARARAPQQLDIIDDTTLRGDRKATPYIAPGSPRITGGDLSTAAALVRGGDLSTATPRVAGGDLSTAKRSTIKADMASGGMGRIEAKRKEIGVSISKLCLTAGIKPRTYQLALRGKVATRIATVRSIADALRRFQSGEKPRAPRTLLEMTYRMVITTICELMNVDAQTVFDTDFTSENSNDPKWLRSSRIKGAAVYLMVEGLGISKASAGYLASMSRQAAFKAVATAEMARDKDEDFDRIMRKMIVWFGNDNAG